jgi:ATPase subunit of ABC transporter with duplicated ATPase domains
LWIDHIFRVATQILLLNCVVVGRVGGMVLVSHDFRLINQVADTILVCGDETVTRWNGDIGHYKATLRKAVMAELEKV